MSSGLNEMGNIAKRAYGGRILALLLLLVSSASASQQCNSGVSNARFKMPPSKDGAQIDMVYIPGGTFWMGANDSEMHDALPIHEVTVDAFWMDITPVTNAQFAKFVDATGYVTLAERPLDETLYPGVPKEKLVAGSIVFREPSHAVNLNAHQQWWVFVTSASWRHPEGPDSNLNDRADHPVVHVTYDDVLAYAQWVDKRLPTEAEWERAARGGLDRKPYVWGDEFMPEGQHMANTFQGNFPDQNNNEDGYIATSPVRSFPANEYGLYDVAGNVWEWVSDWYRPDYYQTQAARAEAVFNPKGPAVSFDPQEPGVPKRVQKGGSYLCTDQYCTRYMPGTRGRGDPNTATSHVGFRLVRDDTGDSER